MNRWKWLAYIVGSILLAIVLAGIWTITQEGDDLYESVDYLVGVSHANLVEEWQIALHDDMRNKANEFSNVKLISSNAGNSSFQQIEDINKLMDYGIDLLIITVNEETALKSTIEAISGKIPVILLDRDVDGAGYALHISPDYYEVGKMSAQRFSELAGDDLFRVLTINGSIENATAIQMNQGFTETALRQGNVMVADQIYLDWIESGNRDKMEALIASSGFDGIYVQSTELVFDVISLMKEYDIDIPLVVSGNYLSDKYLTYVDIGEIDTFIYSPMGSEEALKLGLDYLEAGREEFQIPKRITMNSFYINKERSTPIKSVSRDFAKKIGFIGTELFPEESLLESMSDNWEVHYYDPSDENMNGSDQILLFDELVSSEVDMIILEPNSVEGWEPSIENALDQGIQVICLGNKSLYDTYKYYDNMIYIGPDYDDQSARITTYLVNEVYSTEYDIGILEITDQAVVTHGNEKSDSLSNEISGYSRINVITSINLSESKVDEFEVSVSQTFSKYRDDINVVYIHNDLFAGRIESVMGKYATSDLVVIGSNDTGIIVDKGYIDYQVTTEPIYEEQLMMIAETLYEVGYPRIAEIYLPNQSGQ